MKKLLAVFAVLIGLVIIGVLVFGVGNRFSTEFLNGKKENNEKTKGGGGEALANFLKTGNLVKGNPGMEAGIWYLVFEEAGRPAVSAKLVFDEKSQCEEKGEPKKCDPSAFSQGERAEVSGYNSGQDVLVYKLIRLNSGNVSVQKTYLYYYNPEKDKDENGNVLCSRKGLVAVLRNLPPGQSPIQDAIKELLKGQITEAEKAEDISTEYPLPGLDLKGASLKDGALTLEFSDPQNKTSGGSCRAGILWFQIEATARQFPEVREVKFVPETLFQP